MNRPRLFALLVFGILLAGAVPAAAASTATPPTPTDVRVTPYDRQLMVFWTEPPNVDPLEVWSYRVRATSVNSAGQCTAPLGEPYCSIEGLDNGVTYTISVTTITPTGEGPAATTTASPAGPRLGAPENVRAAMTDSSATITWSPPQTGAQQISAYRVVTRPGSFTCRVPAAATGCTLTGLSAATEYTFSVTAESIEGDSPSAILSAQTSAPATLPGASSGPQQGTPSTPGTPAARVPQKSRAQIRLTRGRPAGKNALHVRWQAANVAKVRITWQRGHHKPQQRTVAGLTGSITLSGPKGTTYRVTVRGVPGKATDRRAYTLP